MSIDAVRLASDTVSTSAAWWRQAAVYQIYPRSFADESGDGIGDLRGILDRVPYLASLSIDAVWLSPFYPSQLADGGYDVDDYRDVDPTIGTLADFDELVTALHGHGIRLIVDLVPNHTSNRHEWFVEALASPAGSPARARYHFRDGLGPDRTEPPSDWTSLFGGSAWEPVGDGQFYLHLFAPEQPDLDWDDPGVQDDFDTTLRFWSDRGVDGFRVDVAHGLAKRLDGELPPQSDLDALREGSRHPLWDRDEVQDIYRHWRRIFDEYDPPRMAVAEAAVQSSLRRARYASAGGLDQAFNFELLEAGYDADAYRDIIDRNERMAAATGSSTTWTFANHDSTRHPTRYGLPFAHLGGAAEAKTWLATGAPEDLLDRELGLRRARAATLMMLALPGSAYLYQGEELGLHEVSEIPDDARQDPSFFTNRTREVGRDGTRVPLPWSRDGVSLGFGDGPPHLPQPPWFADLSVASQTGAPGSTLELYRRALALRRDLQGAETMRWIDDHPNTLHFARPGGWHSVTNFGPADLTLPAGDVLVASADLVDGRLPADATAWVRVPG